MAKTISLVITALLMATMPLGAQPLKWNGAMTQAQAVARARESFGAQLAALDAQTASAQAAAARAQVFPQLSVSEAYNNGSPERLGLPTPFQRFTSLAVSLPIFAPQVWSLARAAGLESEAARATAAMGVNEASADAAKQYDAAALAQGVVEQRAADVNDQRAHLLQTRQRVHAGAAPRYLLSRDQAALARALQSEEDAKADAVRAVHALEVTLDLDMQSTPSLHLAGPPSSLVTDEATLLSRAETTRPDVVASRRIVLAQQQRIARARAEYLPNVSFTAEAFNGTSNPPLGQSGTQVGVVASLPLLDGGARSADVRMARYDYERAQLLFEKTKLQAQADVLDALRDLQASERNLQSADAELRNSQVALRIAQVRERAGKGIELETLDALSALANAREDVLRAASRYDDSVAALHRALGDYAAQPF